MAGSVVNADIIYSSSNILSPTTLFYYLLAPTILLYIVYWKISRKRLNELADKIPGPKGHPFVGNIFELFGTSHTVFKLVISKGFEFGKIVKLWVGPKLTIFLWDPRDVEIILSSQIYIDKSSEYSFFKPWLGDGLLISTGHKWRSHRKLIAPTFHLNVLKSFIDLFNENSRRVVEKLKLEANNTFDVHDHMSTATVEILLETAMGVDSKTTQGQSGYDYAMAVMKMCDILHVRHRNFLLRANWMFNLTNYAKRQTQLITVIHGLTRKVIFNKKEAFKEGCRGSLAKTDIQTTIMDKSKSQHTTTTVEGLSYGQSIGLKDDLDVEPSEESNDIGEKKRLAFLDLLLESAQNGALISDTEIKEQVDTIMFEGHDTTAAGSSFFLSIMGNHQDIQERVYKELYGIFGDSNRPVTFQDTLEMKYLERCLLETLRMFPPVPIVARQIKQEVKLASKNIIIPAGCTVVVGTYLLHRNPEIYPNPDKFDPDNFLPERQANRHYYGFVPFSAGPRSCVGRKYAMLKLKILLSTIIRNFKVYSDIKEEHFKLQGDIILKREEGFLIRLEPRSRVS